MAPPEVLDRQYEAIVAANDRILAGQKGKMAGDYARLLKNLKAAVAEAYENYARGGTLTYADMQRFDRIRKLQSVLDKATTKGTEPVYSRLEAGLGDVVVNSFGRSIAILPIANANMVPELSASEITEILQKPVSGWTLEERIGLRRTDLGNRVRQTVTQGIIRELPYEDQARNLKDLIIKDYARTGKTMEDLGHQVQNDSFVKSFKTADESGIRITKIWVSAGDDKVRDSHAALDGQEVAADEQFVIPSGPNKGATADGPGLFGIPEEDYGCRCWLVAGLVENKQAEPVEEPEKESVKEVVRESEQPPIPEFTPASSRQEAEEFAKNNLLNPEYVKSSDEWNAGVNHQQIKYISYRGLDTDIANRINAELLNQQAKGIQRWNKIITTQNKNNPGILMVTKGDTLEINTLAMGTQERIDKVMTYETRFFGSEGKEAIDFLKSKTGEMSARDRAFVKAAEERLKYGREMVGSDVESVVQHESMHHFQHGWALSDAERAAMRQEAQIAAERSLSSEYRYKISAYGGETSMHRADEHLAESYVAYCKGEFNNLHPDMLKFFRKWLK